MKMKKVFVHLIIEGEANWINEYYHFDRIPSEGEYLATKANGDWYKVKLVLHSPFAKEMNADIYAVKVNQTEEIRKKLNN